MFKGAVWQDRCEEERQEGGFAAAFRLFLGTEDLRQRLSVEAKKEKGKSSSSYTYTSSSSTSDGYFDMACAMRGSDEADEHQQHQQYLPLSPRPAGFQALGCLALLRLAEERHEPVGHDAGWRAVRRRA